MWKLSLGYWATCKGDAKSNIAYCSKQDQNPAIFGEPNMKVGTKEYKHSHREEQNEAFIKRLNECGNAQTFAVRYPAQFAHQCNGI